ncbi:MAG: VCBS repeat-containing protein [Flavobacterium lindanitolerans]|uniref:FG-GAP-like repeat-containing protein n=1 Tax=Flavobacterium lindanitolerans TaxID=428988 RepID=UPI001A3B458A|nr:FG-GAP-like repeat-containing protein [Flavobacterium lindanitolerans]MBL7868456.1 VCBS repeat-containing protein [Flavobacterium lindanitolerans]
MRKIYFLFAIIILCSLSVTAQENFQFGTPAPGVTPIVREQNQSVSKDSNRSLSSTARPSVGSPTGTSSEVGLTEGQLSVSLSGGANYDLPITVPPGINGVIPQISLSFNSHGGNGLAGYGWNISGISTITKIPSTKFHDNEIDAVDFDYSDRFALDGQRLIIKNGTGGTYGGDGIKYETESFSNLRITSYGVHPYGATYGPAYFIVEYPDGSIAQYGNSNDSRSILEWSITYWQNPQGIRINYTYNNANNTLNIASIKYGAQFSQTPINEIQFVYKTRARTEQAYVGGQSILRNVVLSEIKALGNGIGFRNYLLAHDNTNLTYDRLISITEISGDNTKRLNPTVFTYGEVSETAYYDPFVSTVSLSGITLNNSATISGDFNGDGKHDFIIYPTLGATTKTKYWVFDDLDDQSSNMGVVHDIGLFEDMFPVSWLGGTPSTGYKLVYKQGWSVVKKGTSTLDIFTYARGVAAQINYQYTRSINYTSIGGNTSKFYYSGDFDGDGLTDMISVNQGGSSSYFVSLDPRLTTNYVNNSGTLSELIVAGDKVFVADFDGDGKSDLYHFKAGKLRVYSLNNQKQLVLVASISSDNNLVTTMPILIGDYNGDGKADFMIPNGIGYVYSKYLSTGKGFIKSTNTYAIHNSQSTATGNCRDYYHLIPYDFNGDGKTDLLRVRNFCNSANAATIVVEYYANKPSDFVLAMSANSLARLEIGQGVQPVAINFNMVNSAAEVNFISDKYIHRFKSVKSHLEQTKLKEITLGNGVKQAITYSPLVSDKQSSYSNPYKPSANLENYPYYDINAAPEFEVVTALEEVSQTDYKKQSFNYYGAVSSVDGVGFLGFRSILRTNWYNDTNPIVATISNHDISKRGMVYSTYTMLGNYHASFPMPVNYITKTTLSNEYELLGNKVYKIRNLSSSSHNMLEEITQEITNTYDSYENPLTATVVTKRGNITDQTKTTTLGYENYETGPNYIIGRVISKTTSATHNNDTTTSQELFGYNGENALVQTRIKGHNTDYITEDNVYDVYGNLTKKTVSTPGMASRVANFEYDPSNRFLKKSIDIEGLETVFVNDPNNGTLKSETDPYGRTTQHFYDVWFKKTKITDYLGKNINLVYSKPEATSSQITITGDDGSSSMQKFDDLGRVIISGVKDIINLWSYTKTSYDIYDRAVSIAEPVRQTTSTPTQFTTTVFDAYGRPTTINSYTGQVTTFEYNGLTTIMNDGTKTTSTVKNSIGNIISVTENSTNTVTYEYFANGNLKKTSFDGVATTIEQDGWGRKTKLTDNSAGIYQYEYNGFSEITKEITPKGTTTFAFDNFGKVTEKTIIGDLTNSKTTYNYDPQSKLLVSNRYDDFIEGDYALYSYDYDTYKRLILTNESRYLAFYQRALHYDDFGRPERELFSAVNTADNKRSDKWIKNVYKNGYHWRILDNETSTVLWEVNNVNVRGQITETRYGYHNRFDPGVKTTKNYDDYGLPTEIKHYKSGVPVLIGDPPNDENYLILGYSFNPFTGNLNSRTNSNFNWNETFTYDNLNRLKTYRNAQGNTEEQVYDTKGRIQSNNLGQYNYDSNKIYQNNSIDLTSQSQPYYANRQGIYNDSMEEQKGWATYFYYPNISYDNSKSHTGQYSLKITNTTPTEIIALSETRIPINNTVDTEYTYSAWVYSDGAQPEVFLYMGTQNVLNSFDHHDIATTNVTGQWVKVEKTVLVPASMKYLSLRLDNNGNGNIWYDDVRIRKTSDTNTSLRELNITYNTFKSPVQIEETGVDKISFIYNMANQRSSMFYGGLQNDKMQRPLRKHYSIDGSMEIKHNTVTGAVEFLTYIGGDAYTAPLVLKSDGTTQEYLKLLRDYQGTILTILNSSDAILEKRHFDAWGNIISVVDGQDNKLSGLTVIDRGYTGHEHLQSVGLIHMNGRLYDPKLHRFLQPDNFVQDIYDTQNYNRYGYVLNNPLKYVDYSGETHNENPGLSDTQQQGIGGLISSLIQNWDELRIKDWTKANLKSIGRDLKSAGNFLSNNLKSINGWIDNNLRSIGRDIKRFFGGDKYETRKISSPQFSNFQASNGWQNEGFQSGGLGINVQQAGYLSGEGMTLYEGVNIGIGTYGYLSSTIEATLRAEKTALLNRGTMTALNKITKYIDPSIGKIGKISKGLGVVGAGMTATKVGYDFINGKDLTAGQVFDVALSATLAVVAFSNPIALVGFGIYGVLDATGALDSVKQSLGGDTVIWKSPFKKSNRR